MESSNDGSHHETNNDTTYSSDITDENENEEELQSEIFEEGRTTKRKTGWEALFKRVSKPKLRFLTVVSMVSLP